MSMFAYMKVHCPICQSEMDGMKAYGRESRCCGKDCHEEWEWRRTLAIMGKKYFGKGSFTCLHCHSADCGSELCDGFCQLCGSKNVQKNS